MRHGTHLTTALATVLVAFLCAAFASAQDVAPAAPQPAKPAAAEPAMPNPDDLLKNKPAEDKPKAPGDAAGQKPVLVEELGGEGMKLSGGAGNATKDMVDWGDWTKGRVLVVWLFDESLSMKDKQQTIRGRVNDIYSKLELAAGLKGTAIKLLTAVASYGKDTHLITKEPTSDTEAIRKAIDDVPIDSSGSENYLKAINTVMDAYETAARKEQRRIVIIVVTDEGGDDDDGKLGPDSSLERTVSRLKASDAAVMVFGYMGAFSRQNTSENEPGIGSVSVDRGRDAGTWEFLPPNYLFDGWDFYYSGFGPYAYSRLTHETGGVLFLLNTMTSVYDYERLLDGYQPEVLSRQELLMRDRKNPLRSAIRQCLSEWSDIDKKAPLNVWFDKRRMDDMLPKAEKGAQAIIDFCNLWIPRLESVANATVPDSPRRWEADRQLVIAQLYARRYVARSSLVLFKNLREHKNIPMPGYYGWSMSAHTSSDPKENEAMQDLTLVRAKYQEVVNKNPGTPWADLARQEIRSLGTAVLYPIGRGGKSQQAG